MSRKTSLLIIHARSVAQEFSLLTEGEESRLQAIISNHV